jgi:hypothetical protein
VTYADAAPARIHVCRPPWDNGDKAVRTLELDVRIALSGDPVRDSQVAAAAALQIARARERWAQCCIHVELASLAFFDLPQAALNQKKEFIFSSLPVPRAAGTGALTVFAESPPAGEHFVTVYFVGTPIAALDRRVQGAAITPGGMELAYDQQRRIGNLGDARLSGISQQWANTVFIGHFPEVQDQEPRGDFTLSHEIGHVLTKNTLSTILMRSRVSSAEFPDHRR